MIAHDDFSSKILPVTLRYEGGYANVPGDKGGETYCGISYNANPNWPGWEILNRYKPLRRGDLVNDSTLRQLVADVYWERYFTPKRFHHFNHLLPALCCFDFAVHGGFSVERLQRLLSVRFAIPLKPDGVMGAKTIDAVNAQDPKRLSLAILDWRREHLANIIQANPAMEVFAEGWNNRLSALRRIISNDNI
ncbi:MAG: hypothetical protein GYA36_20675 [Veillonellaceae bacterium]|nr:hypothetical protein [Veillonellaceae bacterium]